MIVIHLGLHKTGTTFLQNEIFPKLGYHFIKYYDMKIDRVYQNTIISDETLSGSPHLLKDPTMKYDVIYHLKNLYPHAKIVLGLRDIESWVPSLYSQHLACGGTLEYNEFNNLIMYHYTDFDQYEETIKDLFDDVLIYTQEDLLNKPDTTIADICEFIGCKVPKYKNKTYRKSFTKSQRYIIRNINRILPSKISNILWREVQLKMRS